MKSPITFDEYTRICQSPALKERTACIAGNPCLVVHLPDATPDGVFIPPNCPVIGLGKTNQAQPWADLLVETQDELKIIVGAITKQPVASATLVQVLRHNEKATIPDGLLAESLAYSTLQHSQGFLDWLANQSRPHNTHQPPHAEAEPLLVHRHDDTLQLRLNRPGVHNAFNENLKAALCEALSLAHEDTRIKQVTLAGEGPSFCAGGDLTEFGLAKDAGEAHQSRTSRHAGALLASLDCYTQAILHGACIGAGIEIPAFADRLSAHPDTQFRLPEIAMGLIPGAGGTVSLLRRIGRQRTALLAISNRSLSARTALQWGLIDAIAVDPN